VTTAAAGRAELFRSATVTKRTVIFALMWWTSRQENGDQAGSGRRRVDGKRRLLPRCMEMISSDEVIRRIEMYFAVRLLIISQRKSAKLQRAQLPNT
jgi:hypothetical protein